jgi:hypothetical protein
MSALTVYHVHAWCPKWQGLFEFLNQSVPSGSHPMSSYYSLMAPSCPCLHSPKSLGWEKVLAAHKNANVHIKGYLLYNVFHFQHLEYSQFTSSFNIFYAVDNFACIFSCILVFIFFSFFYSFIRIHIHCLALPPPLLLPATPLTSRHDLFCPFL